MPERRDLSALLLAALRNERCLDLRYQAVFRPPGRYLAYKVMKQVALRRRLGAALPFLLHVAAAGMPLLLAAQWLRALLASLTGAPQTAETTHWTVPTTPTNEALIRAADPTAGPVLDRFAAQLAPRLGPAAVLSAGLDLLQLLRRVLATPGERCELLLHARDAVDLALLARYATLQPRDAFTTEDHYQRWAFVLSHSTRRLRLVQHGLLDHGIAFPHRFGHACEALVRDGESGQTLRRYYACIGALRVHAPRVVLTATSAGSDAVFLASSFPSVDDEIALLRELREDGLGPVLVKLHPAHRYDARKNELLALADHVCRPDENPRCRVFVSHSSSMELLYAAQGVHTVSIQREGGPAAAATAVARLLEPEAMPPQTIS